MLVSGFSKLTVDGLVNEVGTTRPAFYRRYRTIAHLAFEVIWNRFGTEASVNTGSLSGDLLKLQRDEVAMFSDPLLRNNLLGLLESVRTDLEVQSLYLEQFIKPRRANVERVVTAAVARGELSNVPSNLGFVCDLLLGPILARAVLPLPGELDDELAQETASAGLRALESIVLRP